MPGFDYQIGNGATPGVDVRELRGINTLPTEWEAWRNGGTNMDERAFEGFYTGTAAGSWTDWEERMWYLINLFRITLTDTSLQNLPAEDRLGGAKTDVNIVSVNRLDLTQ